MSCTPGTACFVNAASQWAAGRHNHVVAFALALLRGFLHHRGVL